jgi:hypothetical protein
MSDVVLFNQAQAADVLLLSQGLQGPRGDTGASGTLVTSGLTFRTPQQQLAVADDAASDSTPFNNLVTAVKASAITGYQYGNAGGAVYIPQGAPAYRLSTTVSIDIATKFKGDGGGFPPALWSSLVHADPDTTAFIVQSWNTNGATGTDAGDLFTGAGTTFDGVGVLGAYNGTTHLEAEVHAFHGRGTAAFRDGGAFDMQGDAIHLRAGVGLPELGGANGWRVDRFFAQDCRRGLYAGTSDTNAGVAIQLMVSGAREFGYYDESGASNTHLGALIQLCGVAGDGTADKPASGCHSSGHHYFVIAGEEAWCSVNPPSGTTDWNTGWGYFEDGGAVVPGYPTWFNGMVCRAGGASRIVNGGLILGQYEEGSQPPSQHGGSVLTIGGSQGNRPVGGGRINCSGHVVQINSLLVDRGSIEIANDYGGGILVGRPSAGNPAIVRANSSATGLALCAPNGTQTIVATNTDVSLGPCYANSGLFEPFADNAMSLGGSGHRWTELWAASATIQTSDRQHKSQVRDLSGEQFAALLDAVGAVPLVAFKMKDAVKAKGKGARDHYGIIAQDLHDELVKRDLDPFLGGVLGRDPVMEDIEEEYEVEQEATRTEIVPAERVEIIEGKAVLLRENVERQVPDMQQVQVHDEHGEPIIIPGRDEQKIYVPIFDEAGNPKVALGPKIKRFRLTKSGKRVADPNGPIAEIVQPAIAPRPLTHPVPRMETVKRKRIVQRPKSVDGEQLWIWNVRYTEFFALRQAWMERALVRKAEAA